MSAQSLGAGLLDEVRDLPRFVALPSAAALHAAALWTAHTHLSQHFYLAPRLALLSSNLGPAIEHSRRHRWRCYAHLG